MPDNVSPLEAARASYDPRCPPVLCDGAGGILFEEGPATTAEADARQIAARFPRTYGRPTLKLVGSGPTDRAGPATVGVVLSGGQAPGGHNVIAGLHDGLAAVRPGSRLLGFLGGPRGILEGSFRELTAEVLRPYRNTGGFDIIGAGRDKIESQDQLAACRATCERLGVDGLLIIGGDDSNTNAAVLAEYFLGAGLDVSVNGVPKTIDGDLKSAQVEASFGFDTATKVYSEMIGNICRDSRSAAKYWHFIKLMGRSASHVTLECALQTHANIALIGEEVRQKKLTLEQLVEQVATVVRDRARAGKNYGVCLIPEGLIEFIPEMRRLIDGLNRVLAEHEGSFSGAVLDELSAEDGRVFESLPGQIQQQLLQDRDSHGNVQVSRIDTEQLLMRKTAERLAASPSPGRFVVQGHFFGYEGRCAPPSDFDADYAYSLGRTAAILTAAGKTGYLCSIGNLAAAADRWTPRGIPLTSLMQIEQRKGRPTEVIRKALVRLDGEPFRAFAAARERWAIEDEYRYPGPIQYFGPCAVSSAITETLRLERGTSV